MKILVTGGGGFLGQGMAETLSKNGHQLRLMGRSVFETPHERFQGDVTNLEDVRRALQGMDAVVINHMAPRKPDAYLTPEVSFKINVTGTTNVFFAAQELGIRKVVLISSTCPTAPADPKAWLASIPQPTKGLYGLTKVCQEIIARQYSLEFGMQVSMLRVGYIVDAARMRDKYGRPISERAALDTDRRDVGEVARLCLERDHAGVEVFAVMSTHEALSEWGTQATVDALNWTPRYDFDVLPLPEKNRPKK